MIGKIIDETVLMNPLKVDYSKVPDCILECEFCLKFLEDTKMVPGAENKIGNYEAYIALELVSTRVHSDSKKGLDPVGMMNLNIADNGGAGAIVVGDKIQNLDKIDLDKIQFIGYAFQIEMKFKSWKHGFNIQEVPVIFRDRTEGVSKMSSSIFFEAVIGVIQLKISSYFQNWSKNI